MAARNLIHHLYRSYVYYDPLKDRGATIMKAVVVAIIVWYSDSCPHTTANAPCTTDIIDKE